MAATIKSRVRNGHNMLAKAPKISFRKDKRGGHYYGFEGAPDLGEYPSVTTILGAVNSGGNLMRWHDNIAIEYLENIEGIGPVTYDMEDIRTALAQSDKVRDEAAASGTRIHAAIEQFAVNDTKTTLVSEEHNQLSYAIEFLNLTGLHPITAEHRTIQAPSEDNFSTLIAQHPGFGGTIDMIAYHKEKDAYVIIDWKTGNTKHDSHKWQISAYAHTLENILPISAAFVVYTKRREAEEINILDDSMSDNYDRFRMAASAYHATRKKSKVYNT